MVGCAQSATVENPPPPSVAPEATIPPQSTDTPQVPISTVPPEHRAGLGDPDFEDDFSTDAGWENGVASRGAVSRLDGKLVISVQGPASTLWSLSPLDAATDFFAEIDVHTEICDPGDEFGLMVRAGGRGNPTQDSHYRFLITCEGAVRASRFLSGAEAPLIPITASADVLAGAPAINRLGISALGGEFRFFVNDMQVFSAEDGEIATGRIGVIVRARRAPQTTVSFDQFRFWDRSP